MTDYVKTTWQDEPSTATPLSAANLNRMEDGIDTAHSELDTHVGGTAAPVHGSAVVATADRLMHRDAAGRSQVATPQAAADIATKGYVDTAVTGRVEVVGGGSMRMWRPGTTLPTTGAQQDDIFLRKPPA